MNSLEQIDVALFRFINQGLSNPLFDQLMPLFAGGSYVGSLVALGAALLIWKGGIRGRIFVILLGLLLFVGDNLVINMLKHTVARPRPFVSLDEVNLLVGQGSRFRSMPSSHTSTWFAATFITWIFYRKSWRFMLPFACAMAFSRVYLGAHYPADVMAGATLGAGYAAVGLWCIHNAWLWAGPRWFPQWHANLPSFLEPEKQLSNRAPPSPASPDLIWTRLGYVLIGATLLARLLYIGAGKIELSEEEAYQWLWSKYLALSYLSKPPLIAWTQFLGTSVWGDNAFGVRFFSPLLAAGMGLMMLRFMTRVVNPRAGFWLIVAVHCTPLLAAEAVLMTSNSLLLFFWTAALLRGWRALQASGSTHDWIWTGAWLGLACLSSYISLCLIACFAIFMVASPPARIHLRKPGPYLALGINLLCATPALLWNAQHDWITVRHLLNPNNAIDNHWQLPLRSFPGFIGAHAALLNPVFLIATLCSLIALWKRKPAKPLELYLFCMGAPLFLGYCLVALTSRFQINWIAPAILPLLVLMTSHYESRWQHGLARVKPWLSFGIALGLPLVLLLHDTNLTKKIAGLSLPANSDPLRHVRAWSDTAKVIDTARTDLLAEGKEVFIICSRPGLTSQISFHLPEASAALPDTPLVFNPINSRPKTQFDYWPQFRYHDNRKGQNAIYVQEATSTTPPPPQLVTQFQSVTDLGLFKVIYRGRVFRQIQLFQCRNLQRAP